MIRLEHELTIFTALSDKNNVTQKTNMKSKRIRDMRKVMISTSPSAETYPRWQILVLQKNIPLSINQLFLQEFSQGVVKLVSKGKDTSL